MVSLPVCRTNIKAERKMVLSKMCTREKEEITLSTENIITTKNIVWEQCTTSILVMVQISRQHTENVRRQLRLYGLTPQ